MPYSMIPLEAPGLKELQSLPPRVLAGLPLPTQLTLCLKQTGQRLTVHLGEERLGRNADSGQATFSQAELEAIAIGVEHGRASTSDVAIWIQNKATDATFVVTSTIALDGVPAPLRSPWSGGEWSLGEVLRELDASVVEAHVGTEVVHELPQAA